RTGSRGRVPWQVQDGVLVDEVEMQLLPLLPLMSDPSGAMEREWNATRPLTAPAALLRCRSQTARPTASSDTPESCPPTPSVSTAPSTDACPRHPRPCRTSDAARRHTTDTRASATKARRC